MAVLTAPTDVGLTAPTDVAVVARPGVAQPDVVERARHAAPDVVPSPPAAGGAPRNRRLGIVAIVVSATTMGLAGVFGRLATPPGALIGETLTLGRMLVGAIGVFVILTCARRLPLLRQTRLSWPVVLGGIFLGLSLATYLSATVLTDLARAVALHYLGPVIATVLARVVLKESLTRIELVSVGVSFVGMVLAAGLVEQNPGPASDQQVLGDVLGAVSGVLYGLALLCYRYRADMPADVRSFWNFTFGAVGTACMVALTRPDMSGMTPTHWAWALTFFLVCGLLALGLLVVAGKHLRAVELSGLSYWEVVVAMLLGAAVFGEGVSLLAGIGAALIVAAALVPLVGRRRA